MKTTVNNSDFHDAFRAFDRLDNFSYEARNALFDYLEQYEEETGEEMELDVIALCCDFSEMTFEDVAREYRIDVEYDEDADEDERAEALRDAVIEYLEENTQVVAEIGSDSVLFCSAF